MFETSDQFGLHNCLLWQIRASAQEVCKSRGWIQWQSHNLYHVAMQGLFDAALRILEPPKELLELQTSSPCRDSNPMEGSMMLKFAQKLGWYKQQRTKMVGVRGTVSKCLALQRCLDIVLTCCTSHVENSNMLPLGRLSLSLPCRIRVPKATVFFWNSLLPKRVNRCAKLFKRNKLLKAPTASDCSK